MNGSVNPRPNRSLGREYAVYMAMRAVLFIGVLVVLIVIGMNEFLALIVALLVSGIASYPLARKQRDRVAEAYQERQQNRPPKRGRR